jgi:hypothetical protein
MGTITMPREQYAKPFNMGKSLRDLRVPIPKILEVIQCPVTQKYFDKFATIELLDEGMQGEIDYYCPFCDELLIREFRSPFKECFEIVSRDHKIEDVEAK